MLDWIGLDEMAWGWLGLAGLEWIGLAGIGIALDLECMGLGWNGLEWWVGSERTALVWNVLDWIGLDWI